MVNVYIDEQPIECALSDGATVAELIESVRGDLVPPDRLVIGIMADGDDIIGDSFTNTLRLSAGSFSRYDFITGDPLAVVRDALDAAEDLLDRGEETRVRVIDLLTRGQTNEGLAALGECTNAWRQVHDTIANGLAFLKLDPSALCVEGRSVPASLADIKQPLTQIRAALDARDFVLVSDVLQYEFEPVIQNWRSFMTELRACAPSS